MNRLRRDIVEGEVVVASFGTAGTKLFTVFGGFGMSNAAGGRALMAYAVEKRGDRYIVDKTDSRRIEGDVDRAATEAFQAENGKLVLDLNAPPAVPEDRFKEAVEKAQLAFWDELARLLPEIDGDFSSDAINGFSRAAETAARKWVTYGNPK